jgi:hypothetical protein
MVVPFDGDQQDATIVASDIDSYYQQESGPKNDGGGGVDEHGACIDGKKITAYEAAWNVTNAIQVPYVSSTTVTKSISGYVHCRSSASGQSRRLVDNCGSDRHRLDLLRTLNDLYTVRSIIGRSTRR